MVNSLEPDIKMKEDYPSGNEDGKLPMLDTKMLGKTLEMD